jgi:hypothetical protein
MSSHSASSSGPRLAEDRIGSPDLADIVQQRHLLDLGDEALWHAQLARDLRRQLDDRLAVAPGVAVARIQTAEQPGQRIASLR